MAKKGTEIQRWDEEMAKQAEAYAKQEANSGGGAFFGTKGGVLRFNDNPLPNNEIACVILDSVLTNGYYEEDYDENNPKSPDCYAFGRDEDEMSPHEDSEDKQNESCAECAFNVFGSGKGRGKRCKNGRRLALLAAGSFDDRGRFKPYTDEDQFAKGAVGFLNVPPTSINAFGAYVKQIAGTLRLPPNGIFTRVKEIPEGSFFSFSFEALTPVPKSIIPIVMKRRDEAMQQNETFTFPKNETRDPPKKGRAASKGKGKRSKY